jgi:hypothetical protein
MVKAVYKITYYFIYLQYFCRPPQIWHGLFINIKARKQTGGNRS